MESTTHKAPNLIAGVLVKAAGQVLLVRYSDPKKYDGQGGWFLPDDYLAHGEHPSDAARRILREQVGLEIQDPALRHIESFEAGMLADGISFSSMPPKLMRFQTSCPSPT